MLLTLFSGTIRESSQRSHIQRYPPVQSSEMSESRKSNANGERARHPESQQEERYDSPIRGASRDLRNF
jgi:hypothetical protein